MRDTKMADFTINELNRVDQDMFYDELWMLRHSRPLRNLFAEYQFHRYFKNCVELRAYLQGLEQLSCEVLGHHPLAYNRFNPNRVHVPSQFGYERLVKALGQETKPRSDYKEDLFKTILGWWQD